MELQSRVKGAVGGFRAELAESQLHNVVAKAVAILDKRFVHANQLDLGRVRRGRKGGRPIRDFHPQFDQIIVVPDPAEAKAAAHLLILIGGRVVMRR